MSNTFVVIDVETANADYGSICQIGIVTFVDGEIKEELQWLVDPEDYFDGVNVSIHGIDETAVCGTPRFPDIADHIHRLLENQIVVSHTAFDQVALSEVHEKYEIFMPIPRKWLDTAKVCRRTWEQFARRGYGLANVANHCGISFKHHEAVEDARTAGLVLLQAISETGIPLEDWLTRVNQPIGFHGHSVLVRDGNPDGELYGEVVVFTGALSMPRREAADLAASAGCKVVNSMNKKVSLLVMGDQDVRMLGGHEKSEKRRKAEEAISNGQSIRFLTERTFRTLTRIEGDAASLLQEMEGESQ